MMTKRRGWLAVPVTVLAMATQAVAGALPASAAPDGERHGLRGDYHISSGRDAFDFRELKATVVDPNIEFPDLNPVLQTFTGQSDFNTVRWTGSIQPEFSEQYTFSMIGDNGFRLWVDGKLVIDNWVDNWDVEKVGAPIPLNAGQKYDIKVEFFENWGGAHLRLRWQSASQPKEIVPSDALYLPEGFDPPGPDTATVLEDGETAVLDFDRALQPPPGRLTEHLELNIGGTSWPVETAALAPEDASVVVLDLATPVPGRGPSVVVATYDGEGGLTRADGTSVEKFVVRVQNDSRYSITTPWADEVSPDNALPEYPRPQLVRERWQNLNGTWQFAAAQDGESPPVGRELDERILVPYPVESRLSGVERHEDRMWYRRTFSVPDNWRIGDGQRLLLHFDAVDWQATVYVNGRQVATHKGGYDRFSVDVTDALEPGGEQELVVGVYDPTDRGGQVVGKQRLNPGGIFYTAVSGIWQTVWLEPVRTAHVTRLDMTPDVADESLRLTAHTEGVTDEVVVATAYDGTREVGSVTGPAGTELRLPVPDPTLWSPERPHLYDVEVTLRDPDETGRPADAVRSYFGMRTVGLKKVDGTQRMVVNGEPVFHMGPLDQGFWPDGIYTAPTDEALRYDLEETKRLGFNAVRKHVKVEPDRWYYWADRMGLLVWQDMPSMPYDPSTPNRQQFERELREMVDQLRSHPSIVMWVPFNEGWGQYDGARITDMVKGWDRSRLVNGASGWHDTGNGDLIDSHIYTGPGNPRAPSDTRASVLGEYGGLGLPVLGHTWTGGGWGYAQVPDAETLTDRYVGMSEELGRLMRCQGLSAAIYTQTTDVETELNGLMTYDRRVTKPDVAQVRQANQDLVRSSTAAGGLECTG